MGKPFLCNATNDLVSRDYIDYNKKSQNSPSMRVFRNDIKTLLESRLLLTRVVYPCRDRIRFDFAL